MNAGERRGARPAARTPPRVLLLIGSNIDPERHLPAARARLAAEPDLRIEAVSAAYISPAVGAAGTPDFRNQALVVRTELGDEALRARLRAIESALGRLRAEDRNAPRTIDIDIVARFDETGVALGTPDPDLARLHHIAIPAAEVLPAMRLAAAGPTLAELARALGAPPAGLRKCPEA